LHAEVQDTTCDAWHRVVDAVARASREGTVDFDPLEGLTDAERLQVTTLPASIGDLPSVRILRLYSSCLARLPPQIGGMQSLEVLDVYRSYRLHYFPYELSRCQALRDSRVSTRTGYGNEKIQRPFPDLLHPANATTLSALAPSVCSVCASPLDNGFLPRWVTRALGTDWMPLLVYACSTACVDALPWPTGSFKKEPHLGDVASA
jgi:hypothetical protein